MSSITYDDHGLSRRMMAFPQQWTEVSDATMEAVLLHIQGSVPSYPTQRQGSSYVRTGTLGRTLGSSMGGGMSGSPDVKTVERSGSYVQARFGTRLNYAPRVIGAESQGALFKALGWWTMKDVAEAARAGIIELADEMTDALAEWLEGKGFSS
jgi:hypothetical protein